MRPLVENASGAQYIVLNFPNNTGTAAHFMGALIQAHANLPKHPAAPRAGGDNYSEVL
jgi:hypothetical protein